MLTQLPNDEVAQTKCYLQKHFEVETPFKADAEMKRGADLAVGAGAAGVSPDELQHGLGLDFANRLVDARRRSRFNRIRKQHPGWAPVVAEGDSWFLHPLVTDIIDHLSTGYAIRSLAAAGDELPDMAIETIEQALDETDASLLLLSAGGNDLLGDRFGGWIRPLESVPNSSMARTILNDDYSAKIMEVTYSYGHLLETLLTNHGALRIVVHGYDYVVPRYGKEGKWLGKALHSRGFDENHDIVRRAVVTEIVDEFNEALAGIAAMRSFKGRVFVVDARTVVNGWYDEIHPDAANSRRVAEIFSKVIAPLLP